MLAFSTVSWILVNRNPETINFFPSSDFRYSKFFFKVSRCFGFKVRAVDFREYKDESKDILKEIGVDEESSDSEAEFEDDTSPWKKSNVVIIESDEEDDWNLLQINLCVFF